MADTATKFIYVSSSDAWENGTDATGSVPVKQLTLGYIYKTGDTLPEGVKVGDIRTGFATINGDEKPLYWTSIVFCAFEQKIYNRGTSYGVSGDESIFDNGYTSDVLVGGLNKGVNVGGMNAKEVLDIIMKPEYAPVYTAATATITCTGIDNGAIYEVGTKTPADTAYAGGGTPAKTTAGTYVANGTDVDATISINSESTFKAYNTVTTKPGSFIVTATKAYTDGTVDVKTTKGNATNLLGSTKDVLIANAKADTTKVTTDKKVAAVTKSADHTINYTYRIYASTATAGTLTNQGLKLSLPSPTDSSTASDGITLKQGNAGQKIAVPSSYTDVKIYEWNNIFGTYTNVIESYDTSTTTYILPDDTVKEYSVYTRHKPAGQDTIVMISATIA